MEQLILQIVVILLVARATGLLVRAAGQPQVVGEMVGGILLGPSVLGLIDHGAWMKALFPPAGMTYLDVLSQLGVMLFMFLIGLELDPRAVFRQGRRVAIAGFASILGPFVGGLLVALLLWDFGHVRQNTQSGLAFVLFIATALSISAFPVLARILSERNLSKTRVGVLSLACAAINDVVGWCILAVVFDVARSVLAGGETMSVGGALTQGAKTAVFAAVYITVMVLAVRPLLRGMQAHFDSRGYLSRNIVALIFVLILASALTTHFLGIHMVFGAFMLGAVMPSEPAFVKHVFDKIEDFAVLVLMPIFFATIGLNTDLTLLGGVSAWFECGLLLLAALGLKLGFSAFTAKRTGLGARESLLLGVLMSAHGVMELIIINIGREIGAVSPRAFAVMVVVIMASTMIVSPLIRLLYSPRRARKELEPASDEGAGDHAGVTVLIPVALTSAASTLVRMGAMLLGPDAGRLVILHLRRPEQPDTEETIRREDPIEVALAESRVLGVNARALTFTSRAIRRDIVETAARYRAAWLVMGWHKPVFVQSILGGTVAAMLKDARQANVAIFVNKAGESFGGVRRVLVPYLGGPQDTGALAAAERLARLPDVRVTILHVVKPGRTPAGAGAPADRLGVAELVDRHLPSSGSANQVHMRVVESDSPIDIVTEESHRYDLMVLGLSPQWNLGGGILGAKEESVAQLSACSLLIVRGVVNP